MTAQRNTKLSECSGEKLLPLQVTVLKREVERMNKKLDIHRGCNCPCEAKVSSHFLMFYLQSNTSSGISMTDPSGACSTNSKRLPYSQISVKTFPSQYQSVLFDSKANRSPIHKSLISQSKIITVSGEAGGYAGRGGSADGVRDAVHPPAGPRTPPQPRHTPSGEGGGRREEAL